VDAMRVTLADRHIENGMEKLNNTIYALVQRRAPLTKTHL